MVDFYGSFLVIIGLAVFLVLAGIVYFIAKIIIKFIDDSKRSENEQLIMKVADVIVGLQKSNKNINKEELVKKVNMPKKMELSGGNNEFFIKYKKMTYNVNKGRFVLPNV
ncbi:MAG: hypothetical protein FWD22_03190 [Treponema sp.]|nr:hypothetical protein [Treponema sp.]